MKFGAQLRSKSVPEWRSFNIDYNNLKYRIRITTTEAATKNKDKDRQVEELYTAFIEQIDMVNMFVGSKIGELKRRMREAESVMDAQDDRTHDGDVYDVENKLKSLSADLQKLSRFIVIQKTGLRKLLKKYTKYSEDGGELNTRINKYMIQNGQSFIHADLVGFYLELVLLYDLVREKQETEQHQVAEQQLQTRSTSNRRLSRVDPVVGLNSNETFDFQSIRSGNTRETFLVHYDNLVELKLFLLSNFSLVDESVQNERRHLQLHKQKSQLSFRQLLRSRNSSSENISRPLTASTNQADDVTEPQQYSSNSIYISNNDDLSNTGTTTELFLDDPKHLQSIQMNTDPGILLHNDRYPDRKLLISAIGGLRKTANVLLHDKDSTFTDELLHAINTNEKFETFVSRHLELFRSLDSLEKISIEWLFSRNIKPITKVSSTRARFASRDQSINLQSWITLSSNIKFSSEDLTIPHWTETNEASLETLPYAILEIRFNAPVPQAKIPEKLQKLLESHLIYRVDNTLTLLTYYLYLSDALGFTPVWAQLFGDDAVDIRKSPPRHRRDKTTKKTTSLSDKSTKHNSVSGESSQFRYWNEFDNGSDTEQGGFYIDVESDGETLFPSSGVEYLFKITGKMNSYLHEKMPFMFDDTMAYTKPLLNSEDAHYGSVTDHSDVESFNDSASQVKAAHDALLVFLAVSSALLSLVLVSVSLGITTSLLGYENIQVSPMVIGTLVVAMLSSLFFSVVSLCFLMMCDGANRKGWQTGFVWTVFILVTVLIMYGMVSVFDI